MPARQKYSREIFLALYKAIEAKLLKQTPPIVILKPNGKQDTTQLGIEWEGPIKGKEAHNAAAVIHRTLVQSGKIEQDENLNFGKLLYSRWKELNEQTGKPDVVIQGEKYYAGLYQFLGFDRLEDFKPETPLSQNATLPITLEKPSAISNSESPYTYYIGAYYSFRSYRVNKFVLAIQYTDSPTQPMNCWQWGFHTTERHADIERIPDRVNSVLFKGTAVVSGRHLYINLAAPASSNIPAMEMHLTGICDELGGHSLAQQDAIPCALQAISLDQYVVSIETFLLRASAETANHLMETPSAYYDHRIPADALLGKSSREKALQLYLMLQRRNFRVKFKPNVSDLDDLEYRGNLVNKYTERLSGEYRIWNFGLRRGVVIQSKLVVRNDVPYQTHFYPYLDDEFKRNNPGLEEQLVVLVISNELRQDQLCFSTFIKRGPTLVNYAIFDIRNLLKDDKWVEGMFITTGYDHKGIIGGYAVMCKVKPGQTCEPAYMNREAAEKYAKELGLTSMLEGLRKLWKRKLWRQKSNTQFGCYAVVTSPEMGILMVRKEEGPYKGQFDLPGGKILPDETAEEGLKRSVFEETGVNILSSTLWVNESITVEWKRPDLVEEKLHHVGALYRVKSEDIQIGQLDRQAFWIKKGQYNLDAFSPFARKALEGVE